MLVPILKSEGGGTRPAPSRDHRPGKAGWTGGQIAGQPQFWPALVSPRGGHPGPRGVGRPEVSVTLWFGREGCWLLASIWELKQTKNASSVATLSVSKDRYTPSTSEHTGHRKAAQLKATLSPPLSAGLMSPTQASKPVARSAT